MPVTTDEQDSNFQGFFHHVGVPFITKTQHYKMTKDVVNRGLADNHQQDDHQHGRS